MDSEQSKEVDNDYPYKNLSYSSLVKKVDKKTQNKIREIFSDSSISSWLLESNGSTYVRLIFEFKPIAEQRFRSEYLKQELEARIGCLLSEKTQLKSKIGSLSAGLKPWEGGLISWLISPFSMALEWLLKASLAIIPILSLIVILDSRSLSDILRQPNFFTYLAIFSGFAFVQLISSAAYNWVVSSSSSKILQSSFTFSGLNRFRVSKEKSEYKSRRRSFLFRITQFNVLLFIICIVEAWIGYSVIVHFFEVQNYSIQLQYLLRQQPIGSPEVQELIRRKPDLDTFSLFLSSSIFALTNLMFSVAKANRFNRIKSQKKDLDATVRKLRHLDKEIYYCQEYLKRAMKDFEKSKTEYNELLGYSQAGILSEIRILSNQAYTDKPEIIKSIKISELGSSNGQVEISTSDLQERYSD